MGTEAENNASRRETGCSIQKKEHTSKTYPIFHDLTHKITHKKQHKCMFIRLFDGIIARYLPCYCIRTYGHFKNRLK